MPILLGCVLAVGAMELAVRRVYDVSFVDEPGIGDVMEAGKTARWGREGHAESHWTVHGLRGRTTPNAMADSVLVLGDSFTEALMVMDDDVYTARAESALRDRRNVQVLNAGRSSCSIADYIHLAPHYEELFHARWTVLELRSEDLGSESWMTDRTHFAMEDGELRIVPVSPPRRAGLKYLWWRARQRSMAVGYVAIRMGEIRKAAADEPPLFRAGSYEKRAATTDDPSNYPIEKEIDQAVAAFRGRVTFLYLADYEPKAPLEPSSLIERRLFDHCVQRALSCVNTRWGYARLPPQGIAPFGFPNTAFNTGHMNETGHAIAGALLAAELGRLTDNALF
jgi:hypothetical protein